MRFLIRLCLAGVLLSTVCCGSYVDIVTEEAQFRGYIPVEPVPVNTVRVYDPSCNGYDDVCWASLSSSERIKLLPLQTAEVSVKRIDAQSSVKFVGSSANVGEGHYEVVMDYMKYLVDTIVNDSGQLIGSRRVGVGLRMTARVRTTKGGINIAGLSALAAEVSLEHLSGSLSVNVIGIDSKDVTNLIPITSQLDQTSIEAALQALAAVKTKMWDLDETTITPHIVAVQQREDGSVDNILQGKPYRFEQSALGDCIRAWWKPNGRPDPARTDSLKSWLAANESSGAPQSITDLISGSGLDDLRAKAIKDLGITCGIDNDTLDS